MSDQEAGKKEKNVRKTKKESARHACFTKEVYVQSQQRQVKKRKNRGEENKNKKKATT